MIDTTEVIDHVLELRALDNESNPSAIPLDSHVTRYEMSLIAAVCDVAGHHLAAVEKRSIQFMIDAVDSMGLRVSHLQAHLAAVEADSTDSVDALDARIEQLQSRVVELESRLAAAEARNG